MQRKHGLVSVYLTHELVGSMIHTALCLSTSLSLSKVHYNVVADFMAFLLPLASNLPP